MYKIYVFLTFIYNKRKSLSNINYLQKLKKNGVNTNITVKNIKNLR